MSAPRELPMLPIAPEPVPDSDGAPEADARGERYRVEGMDCAACAQTVQRVVAALDGVRAARVSFGNATLTVDGDVAPDTVSAAIARAGYRAAPATRRRTEPAAPFWRRDARTVSTVFSVGLLAVAVAATLAGVPRAVAEPLYLASMVVGGWAIARAALAALRRRSLDMNVLMTLAAVGAVGIGSYAEGAWVLVLFAVGTTLETYAFDRSRRSVTELMELAPQQARVLDAEGGERLVPVEEITAGARFVVRPGERIALDGEVAGGASSVDEAPITGESVPVDKHAGSAVFAGTLNAHGSLTVIATKAAEDSTLARVAALVEEAQGSRAPSERFVDRFARVYTPLVFAAALALIVVPVALGGEVDTWVYRALALLIVACPCSLVISIPVAVVSAVGRAARDGVLIKGGRALEDLARVHTVALDKTGTLTEGKPRLSHIGVLDGRSDDDALALAALVERRSEHPLAQAVVAAARARSLDVGDPDDFRALPGRGVTACVGGRELWMGGPRLAEQRLGAMPEEALWVQARGETAMVLGEADRPLAVFGLADQPRPGAADAVANLRAAGVGHIVILTGDNEQVAARVSSQVDADEYRAALFPEDKLAAVRSLDRTSGPVAMVGDGINDAPALAAARVGIAMGAAGTDAALESADVALMSDDLLRLPGALTGARRALGAMRQNVIASLAVKAVFVVLAPLGLVTLVMAVAADMGMSLLVTLNGLRLLPRSAIRPARTSAADAVACADHCCAGNTQPPTR